MAGYSPQPLIEKLGIKSGMKIAILDSPKAFTSTLKLPNDIGIAKQGKEFDAIMYFSNSFGALRKKLPALRNMIKQDGMIWICWPKTGAKLLGDFKEDDVRRLAIGLQLVDVKVAAVDETWSGLKLVIPVALRTLPAGKSRSKLGLV